MTPSQIDPGLVRACQETHYRVCAQSPFTLEVSQFSEPLQAAHAAHHVHSSAFITAWNPYSQASDAASNAHAQQALLSDLATLGLHHEHGVGQHPSNAWPGEDSVLVFSLGLDEARALGQRHEQNAIVWAGADAIPQLILLR